MNWLLLPEDDVELAEFVSNELGLTPIGPRASSERELPQRHSSEPFDFVFWAEEIGPLRRLGEAPEPTDPIDTVLRQMNREAHPGDWESLIDVARTPVIRFRRTNWNENGCLNPGLLQAMAISVKEHPPELLKLREKAARWLKRSGERLNPFEHCAQVAAEAPRNLNVFWVWARPHALA